MSRDRRRSDDGPLAPDELDLPPDAVRALGANRYVVDADADGDAPTRETARPRGGPGPPPLGALPERYAFDLAAKEGDGVERTRIASDDVRAAFDGLLRWYAARVAPDRPPERVLSVLARESAYLPPSPESDGGLSGD